MFTLRLHSCRFGRIQTNEGLACARSQWCCWWRFSGVWWCFADALSVEFHRPFQSYAKGLLVLLPSARPERDFVGEMIVHIGSVHVRSLRQLIDRPLCFLHERRQLLPD